MLRRSVVLAGIGFTMGLAAGPAVADKLAWLAPDEIAALPSQTVPWGAKLRVLAAGEGIRAIRAVLPASAEIPPHPHPAGLAALVTVLAGEIEFGLGDVFDAERLERVPISGMVLFRVDDPQHFARTGPDGAELLVMAVPGDALAPALQGR